MGKGHRRKKPIIQQDLIVLGGGTQGRRGRGTRARKGGSKRTFENEKGTTGSEGLGEGMKKMTRNHESSQEVREDQIECGRWNIRGREEKRGEERREMGEGERRRRRKMLRIKKKGVGQ